MATMLNGDYYNGLTEKARSQIANTIWFIGLSAYENIDGKTKR